MASQEITGIFENAKELDRVRKELDRVRKELDDVIGDINKIHKKLQTNPEVVEKPGDTSLSRLKIMYSQAKELSESEMNVSSALVAQLDALMTSGPTAQPKRRPDGGEPRRKKIKNDSEISRFITPSMKNQLKALASLKGHQVAARLTGEDAENDEWVIVKVTHFDRETKEFEVLDVEPGDDEDSSGQRKYKLPMSHIVQFPKQNDPSSAPEFSRGTHVLAVYPGTTALYKATVVNSPRKRKSDDYLLEFDDDDEDGTLPQRNVPFHMVVPLPEGHRH